MKSIALTVTAVTLVLGSAAFAGPVEDFATKLTAEGYTGIEQEAEDGLVEFEAMLDGVEYEFIIDPATGEIMSEIAETEDDDDDDDDDDEDGEDDT